MTPTDGQNCEKPLLDFRAEVATISLTIATDRKNHCIPGISGNFRKAQ